MASPIGFYASPVGKLLPGLTSESFWNGCIFPCDEGSIHQGTEAGCWTIGSQEKNICLWKTIGKRI